MIFSAGRYQIDLEAKVAVMGVINITPDSFSDGGRFFNPPDAIGQAERLLREGADIVDIGGESSRPGSNGVSVEEEIRRVIPVVREVASWDEVPVSIDTRKPEVARKAVEAGALIVNDIGGLQKEPDMAAALAGASVIVMHMKGDPDTMQNHPVYEDLLGEIHDYLSRGVEKAVAAGVDPNGIAVDPGIGFGKTVEGNLEIINNLEAFADLGKPILIGPSRKSFIGKTLDLPVEDRLEGTMAAVAAGVLRGARIVRVHDVLPHRRLVDMLFAIMRERIDDPSD